MYLPVISTFLNYVLSRKSAMLSSATREGKWWERHHEKEMQNLEFRLETRHREELDLKDVELIRLGSRIELLEEQIRSMERLHDKSVLRAIENEKVASQMEAAIFRMLNKHSELYQFIVKIKELASSNHTRAITEDNEFKKFSIPK